MNVCVQIKKCLILKIKLARGCKQAIVCGEKTVRVQAPKGAPSVFKNKPVSL